MTSLALLLAVGWLQFGVATKDCSASTPLTTTPGLAPQQPGAFISGTTVSQENEPWNASEVLEPSQPLPSQQRPGVVGVTYRFGSLRIKLERAALSANRRYAQMYWHVCNDARTQISLSSFQARASDRSGGLLPVSKGWVDATTEMVIMQIPAQSQSRLITRVDFPSEGDVGREIREVSLGRVYLVTPRMTLSFDARNLLR